MASPDINRILAGIKAYDYRGADMGRRPDNSPPAQKLYLQRVRLDTGGYDTGGAYWGTPSDLWCAFTADSDLHGFVRAPTRRIAKDRLGFSQSLFHK